MRFEEYNESEKAAFRKGQEIVVDEFLSYIAELEKTRNPKSSYGRGQLYILRELVREITKF